MYLKIYSNQTLIIYESKKPPNNFEDLFVNFCKIKYVFILSYSNYISKFYPEKK
jgi:hypothetical protein